MKKNFVNAYRKMGLPQNEMNDLMENVAYACDIEEERIRQTASRMEGLLKDVLAGSRIGLDSYRGISGELIEHCEKQRVMKEFLLDTLRVVNTDAPKAFLKLFREGE